MNYDPEVWGPHFWFTIFTMAITYPKKPSNVTKKKYYDFIINLPIFLPCQKCGDHFAILLDKYPVTPYLDSRDSFIRWVHFIHNRVNEELDEPKEVITLEDALYRYHLEYKNHNNRKVSSTFNYGYITTIAIIITMVIVIFYFYTYC
jgi:hypothetical protein